jgi:hypothetical protein
MQPTAGGTPQTDSPAAAPQHGGGRGSGSGGMGRGWPRAEWEGHRGGRGGGPRGPHGGGTGPLEGWHHMYPGDPHAWGVRHGPPGWPGEVLLGYLLLIRGVGLPPDAGPSCKQGAEVNSSLMVSSFHFCGTAV